MKIVIFAGGVGTRLWPLSRKNTPKQFEKILGDASTLQETVKRLLPEFAEADIYIATGKRYQDIVREQLPAIAPENFIFEPQMRDVGPAIGLVANILAKRFPNEPLAILWSDHLVKHEDTFRTILRKSESLIKEGSADFIFIGQKPRFANQNIGWIEIDTQSDQGDEHMHIHRFKRLRYRPNLSVAKEYVSSQTYVWNLGYFVTTPAFLTSLFRTYVPQMSQTLEKIAGSYGTEHFQKDLDNLYPTLEKISFDDAILEKLRPNNILVVSADLGWSDVGAWEALKEALSEEKDENVTKGNVLLEDSRDSLVFNYGNQLAVGIDLNEMLVINTDDVILICPKTAVPKIKKLVESLAGTAHEKLT